MTKSMPAVLFRIAGIFLPLSAAAAASGDDEALAILQRHCVVCHAARPAHKAFPEPPKNIALETLAQLKQHAQLVYQSTVLSRSMPLGNQARMTERERETLGRWLKELP